MGTKPRQIPRKPAAQDAPAVRTRRAKAPRLRRRTARPARRDAILDAALDEFAVRGFAAARLDDVAERAGVAKGTIYLYFEDKEELFEDLILSKMTPVVGRIEAALAIDLPLRVIVEQLIELFVREILGTRRKDLIRLIISEGPRFPALAEFYYREVLVRVMNAARVLLLRAFERGELADDSLARFPQLLGAPGIVAVVWSGLFERFGPLDARGLMRTYFDHLLAPRSTP